MVIYTQNIDGIDATMEPLATKVPLNVKGPWPKQIQLHRSVKTISCTRTSQNIVPVGKYDSVC
jgi:NAD+-dependent protein deacetylase SIR2